MSIRGSLTPSTGNVFRDLGFSKEESEHLFVRADLLIHVQKAIASRGLKQAEAANALRVLTRAGKGNAPVAGDELPQKATRRRR